MFYNYDNRLPAVIGARRQIDRSPEEMLVRKFFDEFSDVHAIEFIIVPMEDGSLRWESVSYGITITTDNNTFKILMIKSPKVLVENMEKCIQEMYKLTITTLMRVGLFAKENK